MSNKTLNFISNVILPVTVFIATAALFLVFQPEDPAPLFYFNLAYTVLLEAIFFGYVGLLYIKTSTFSTPLYALFGVMAAFYLVAGVGWMLLYSLVLLPAVSLKMYISVIVVLTLLWIVLSVLMAKIDGNYKATTNRLKDQHHTLAFYTQKITLLASRYEKLCEEKGIRYQTDSNNRTALDKLMGKISFLTPNIFTSETACSQLTAMLGKCEDIIEETETADGDRLAELDRKMQRFVNNSIDELNMLKNLTRRT
jgi:hypothetical protein